MEREAQRNLEVLWLTGRLAPDFITIAHFRRDNGPAIKATCRQFVLLCRRAIPVTVLHCHGTQPSSISRKRRSRAER